MSNETHYMDIRVGIDFGQIFSPERIQGVKFLLGVEDDEAVAERFANDIYNEVAAALSKRASYVDILSANITPVAEEEQATEYLEEDTDGVDSDYDTLVDEVSTETEVQVEESEIEPETEPDEDMAAEEPPYSHPPILDDNHYKQMIEELRKDIFTAEAYMSTDIHIYLSNFKDYGSAVWYELQKPVHSTDELVLKEEDKDKDYIIGYTTMDGAVKYGSRKINEEDKGEQ